MSISNLSIGNLNIGNLNISELSISDMSDVRSTFVQIGTFRAVLKGGRRVGMVVTTMFVFEGGLQ